MIDIRPAHHLAVVLGGERNVTAVVEGVQRATSLDEVFNGCALLFRNPGLELLLGKVPSVLKRVGLFVVVGLEISLGPNHAIAQNKKQAVGPKKARGNLVVVNGVIDRQVQLAEEPVQGDPDVIGVVISVPNKGKRSRPVVVGREGPALFTRFEENSCRSQCPSTLQETSS